MTEITRVPLKPVAKGSLTKLWLGVFLAVLLGGGLAWAASESGPAKLDVTTLVEGTGPKIAVGDVAWVKYTGKLASTGEVFDETPQLPPQVVELVRGLFPDGSPWEMVEGRMIPGFFNGLQEMQKGGKYELYIPSDQAYGSEPPPGAPIPPDADLIFEVEVVDIMSQETYERNLAILQQMIQSGAGGSGGPGGQAGPPPGEAPQGAPTPPPVSIPAPGQ